MRYARYWRAVAAIGFALGVVSAAAGEVDQIMQASKHCQRGFRLLEKWQVDKARASFEKALKLVPSYPDGHVGLGHLALNAKQYEAALAEYELAREGYTKLGDQLFNQRLKRYNESRSKVNDLKQLLSALESGQEGDPTSTQQVFRITAIQVQIETLENLPPPTKATATEPPGELDFHVGNALARLGRWEEAIEALESCIRKSPEFAAAHNNVALAYWRVGRVEDARKSLVHAEALGFDVNPKFKADLGL
jgi:tetratricopeptide (TPR) repeat protein